MSDPNFENPIWRLENLYLIRTKKAQISKLKLNRIQKILLADIQDEILSGKPVSNLTLKFRQGGASTFFNILHLDRTIFRPNTNTGILADLRENLGYLFEMIRFAHESMPPELRPPLGSDSKSELSFPSIGSKIMVSLAFKSTTLHGIHVSERAYIDLVNLQRSIGACTPDAWITEESTANGYNHLRDEWIERKVHGKPGVFLPWPLQDEYRDEVPPGVSVVRTEEEDRLARSMVKFGVELDDGQILYRRRMKRKLQNIFSQEMAESEDECFLATGGAFFDGKKIDVLIQEALSYQESNTPFVDDGEWIVFERPQHRHVYVIGADVAEGKTDGRDRDFSSASVLCITCRKTAARYTARCGVDAFYRLLYRTGMEYNRALLGVERNGLGLAVVMGLQEKSYPHIYRMHTQKTAIRKTTTKESLKFGWETTGDSKPIMMEALRRSLEGNSDEDEDNFQPGITWLDIGFLKQTFDITEMGGKIEAVAGKHDDITMGYAIAWQMYLKRRSYLAGSDLSNVQIGNKLESA
mgnify:CR=1 FL=1